MSESALKDFVVFTLGNGRLNALPAGSAALKRAAQHAGYKCNTCVSATGVAQAVFHAETDDDVALAEAETDYNDGYNQADIDQMHEIAIKEAPSR